MPQGTCLESANAWLPRFIEDFNRRYRVAPANPTDAFRPVLHSPQEIDQIFCLRYPRTLSKNLSFQFHNIMAWCKRTISSSEKSPAATSKTGNRPYLSALLLTPMHRHLPTRNPIFIERHGLMGRGIGYVDASILASTVLVQTALWSRDKRLMSLATDLGSAYSPKSSE